jgi:hypothetical protein
MQPIPTTTAFSYEARVLLCEHCGAPLEVPGGGGTVTCRYCGAVSMVAARRIERRVAPDSARIPEDARIAILAGQTSERLAPPALVRPWLDSNVDLLPSKLPLALATFRGLLAAASPQTDETLYVIAVLLANHFMDRRDSARARAVYEQALEVLVTPRYRQMTLGTLARLAAFDGEVGAAEAWLRDCDPRSTDLASDTAYRLGRSAIATARGDWPQVIELLSWGTPIFKVFGRVCDVLWANACEKNGSLEPAARRLALAVELGPSVVASFIRSRPEQKLCERSYPMVLARKKRFRRLVAAGVALAVATAVAVVWLASAKPWKVARACPAPASAAAAANKGGHGAIAHDARRDRSAWGTDAVSREQARARALATCGPDCKVVLEVAGGCGAYATDHDDAIGCGTGPTKDQAEGEAMSRCRARSSGCRLEAWVCAPKP